MNLQRLAPPSATTSRWKCGLPGARGIGPACLVPGATLSPRHGRKMRLQIRGRRPTRTLRSSRHVAAQPSRRCDRPRSRGGNFLSRRAHRLGRNLVSRSPVHTPSPSTSGQYRRHSPAGCPTAIHSSGDKMKRTQGSNSSRRAQTDELTGAPRPMRVDLPSPPPGAEPASEEVVVWLGTDTLNTRAAAGFARNAGRADVRVDEDAQRRIDASVPAEARAHRGPAADLRRHHRLRRQRASARSRPQKDRGPAAEPLHGPPQRQRARRPARRGARDHAAACNCLARGNSGIPPRARSSCLVDLPEATTSSR